MPEAALRVQKQFWKPLDRAVRRVRRPRTVELWQPPFRRPFRLRAEQRGTGLGGVRNPLGGVRSPFGGQRTYTQRIKSLLFSAGQQGWFYDASDMSTLFQDSTGETPVTAVEQPVGLQLDKSKGLAVGSELITNPGFDADTGWTKETGWTISGGEAVATNATSLAKIYQTITTTAGTLYRVTINCTSLSEGAWSLRFGGTQYAAVKSSTGTQTAYFIASSSSSEIAIIHRTSGAPNETSGTWDNISCKSISGNHRYQSTSAARPTLSARYNLLTKTEDFSHADWSGQNGCSGSTTKITATTTNTYSYTKQSKSLTINTTYILVVEAKPDTANYIWLLGETSGDAFGIFDLGSGTYFGKPTSEARAPNSAAIVALSDGYYRCSITFTKTSASASEEIGFGVADGTASTNVTAGKALFIRYADCRPANDGVGLPAYQRVNTSTDYDTSGFPEYLKYDGVDDFMETAAVDFSAGDAISVFCGARKLSDAAQGILLELTSSLVANNGSFNLSAPNGASATFAFNSKGTAATDGVASSQTAPLTALLTGLADISADTNIIRVNGTQIDSDVGDQGTGNYSNAKLYFGARAGTSLFFNGREYQSIGSALLADAATIASVETFVNSKTKAF